MDDQTRRYCDGTGYDHDLYAWNPLTSRQPLDWPNGAKIALCVNVYFEYMELDTPDSAIWDARFAGALGSYGPDFQNYSRREFGNRVGIFRVLDALSRHGIRATICANAMAAERYAYVIDYCRQAGHAFAAHGWSINRMITSEMSEAQERAYISETLTSLDKSLGERVAGWAGQGFGESERTPRLLAEAGLSHVVDWPNDDEPYFMETTPPLVSIPNQSEWDDAQLFAVRKVDTWRYPEIVGSAFDQLYTEGGRLLGLCIHPWIFGQAYRIRYLEEALAHIMSHEHVWNATTTELTDTFRSIRPRS